MKKNIEDNTTELFRIPCKQYIHRVSQNSFPISCNDLQGLMVEWRRHPVIQWGQPPICVVRYIGCPYCNIRSNICMCYKGVSRKLSGRYQCRASNLEGDSASNYIHLDIKCKNNVLAVQGIQDKLSKKVGGGQDQITISGPLEIMTDL